MFLDELSPIAKELISQPISFLGGLFSGVFRLNLADDPVKSWLDQQVGSTTYSTASANTSNGSNNKPQSIAID